MKHSRISLASALLLSTISSMAFAQAGANPSAPTPNSSGTGITQPGITSTGTAVDAPMSDKASKKKSKKKM